MTRNQVWDAEKKRDGLFGRYRSFRMTFKEVWMMFPCEVERIVQKFKGSRLRNRKDIEYVQPSGRSTGSTGALESLSPNLYWGAA